MIVLFLWDCNIKREGGGGVAVLRRPFPMLRLRISADSNLVNMAKPRGRTLDTLSFYPTVGETKGFRHKISCETLRDVQSKLSRFPVAHVRCACVRACVRAFVRACERVFQASRPVKSSWRAYNCDGSILKE